jgi:protein-tyrosine phosphatase
MGSRLSAQEVIDKGNLYDQNKQQYSGKDFHIICVASPETCEYCSMSDKFNSYRIHDKADVVADDIKDMIERVVCKMHKKLKKNKVMVHCHSGRNRSALAILAYCAKYTNYTYGEALFQIRSLNSHRFPMQSTLQNNEFTSFMRRHWDEFRENV